MCFKRFTSWYSKNMINKTIAIILLIITATIFIHARFNRSEGVIIWDVKSYYSYLPATLIYNDLSYSFMDDEDKDFGKWIWPFETPTGKKAVGTTYGMSLLYSPFFMLGHVAALISNYDADGYSRPYHVALNFSAMFYLWLGMICLVKVLRRYFKDKVIAFTLFAIVIGTNLFYYTTREAPMTHSFLFSLFALFLWLTIKFYDKPSLKRIMIAGLVAGLITLVRPTNIIVLLVFFLWNISSFDDLKNRARFFTKKYYWVALMAAAFVLIWVPQFIYWHYVSGKIFYFTYGESGGGFFFNNPQIFNILFSYKKGWLVYTPLMIFALAGIFMLRKKIPGLFLPLLLFKAVNIYILASWWCWWFGGSFGLRSFIESYAFLSIPFACFVDMGFRQKNYLRIPVLSVLVLLIGFNQFQTRQYNNNAIHWWWMNKEAYWETFLKLHPTERFWEVITIPDYDAAREGIYREIEPSEEDIPITPEAKWKNPIPKEDILDWLTLKIKNDSTYRESLKPALENQEDTLRVAREVAEKKIEDKGLEYWDKKMAIELIIEEIRGKPEMMKSIEEKAIKNNNPLDSQLVYDAIWLYNEER